MKDVKFKFKETGITPAPSVLPYFQFAGLSKSGYRFCETNITVVLDIGISSLTVYFDESVHKLIQGPVCGAG